MITYYEMINYLEELKKSPKDDVKLLFLKEHNIDMPGNVMYRYIDNITDLIKTRLNNAIDNFILKLKNIKTDDNLFSLEIIELKKEISYDLKIVNSINIPIENKNKLKETIKNFAYDTQEIIINNVRNIDNTGKLVNIIKSHNLTKLED